MKNRELKGRVISPGYDRLPYFKSFGDWSSQNFVNMFLPEDDSVIDIRNSPHIIKSNKDDLERKKVNKDGNSKNPPKKRTLEDLKKKEDENDSED